MPRRFPMLALAAFIAVSLLAVFQSAFGQSKPAPAPDTPPPTFPNVELEPANGSEVSKGKLKLASITLETDLGTMIVKMTKVRSITFQTDADGKARDAVQLTDKSVIHGRVTDEQFTLVTGVGEQLVKKETVRLIKVVNDTPVPFVSILVGLLTLTAMEIILGVDNVIFLAIVVARAPKEQQSKARKFGLAAALGTRILLLLSLSWILGLAAPVFTLPTFGVLDLEAREVSWRDIILLAGGMFLIGKSATEMHEKLESAKAEHAGEPATTNTTASFAKTIVTIAIIDIVFSLDSVITAVGMVDTVWVMITAMVIAMLVMVYFAGPIGDFVEHHPTVKVLALSFLILIGVLLVAEGFGQHIDKGYIYAAMAFAVIVEIVNMKLRKPAKAKPAAA